MDILIWGILIVVFVILELCTVQLVSVWFAAAAGITLICASVSDISLIMQVVIFTVCSAVFLILSIPLIKRRQNVKHIATNSELNIGKIAAVIEDINLSRNSGRVTLAGVDWSAVSENGDIIPKDSIVTVTGISGSKLIVKIKN